LSLQPLILTLVVLAALAALGWLSGWLERTPRGEPDSGAVFRAFQLYAALVHRLKVLGRDQIPREISPGGLIVVANHTGGVDPVLVQAALPFEVRWMMASDMQFAGLDWLWELGRVIGVDRSGRDTRSAREAMRHLEGGGVIGIFPEGGIARPARTLRPFMAGVGLIVKRTGARVLPVVIEGTPDVELAWSSLVHPSRATVRVLPTLDYSKSDLAADEIARDLQARYADWTGWRVHSRAEG
jgi:1-acyl-sn-glycerol-3-phosphate acyltransferase